MAHGRAACTCARLFVRADHDLKAKIVGALGFGQVVDVWSTDGEWWRVQTEDGLTGWSHGSYLQSLGDLVR